MAGKSGNYPGNSGDPAFGGAIVVPDTPFTQQSRGIWVGGAGNVSAVMADGSTIILIGVLAGSLLPLRATNITVSGTTATNMVALF